MCIFRGKTADSQIGGRRNDLGAKPASTKVGGVAPKPTLGGPSLKNVANDRAAVQKEKLEGRSISLMEDEPAWSSTLGRRALEKLEKG